MPRTKHSLTYVKFLHLANALRQMPSLPALDTVEERLLNVFAAAWHAGRQVAVMEATRMVPDMSERTVFRRLKTLESKGLLKFGANPLDHRVRYILPTDQTEKYFHKLGECMERARSK